MTFGVGSAYLEDHPAYYEKVPVELQHRYENNSRFHDWVDATRERLIAGGGMATTDAVICALGAVDGVQDEIPARDTVPYEVRRRYMNDPEFHARVEMISKQALAEETTVTTGAIIVILNILDQAQREPSLSEVIERGAAEVRSWPAWAQPFRGRGDE